MGRANELVRYLAEKNREDLRLGNDLLLDVESVARERGVREALVVDAKGRILAPVSRINQSSKDPFTLEALQQNSDRKIQPSPRLRNGTHIFLHPIRAYNEGLGTYETLREWTQCAGEAFRQKYPKSNLRNSKEEGITEKYMNRTLARIELGSVFEEEWRLRKAQRPSELWRLYRSRTHCTASPRFSRAFVVKPRRSPEIHAREDSGLPGHFRPTLHQPQ